MKNRNYRPSKEFKVSETLLPTLERVLNRRNIKYTIVQGLDEHEQYIQTKISGTYFHKCVVRAACEKTCQEKGLTGLWVAKSEENDPVTLANILEEYRTNVYSSFEDLEKAQ